MKTAAIILDRDMDTPGASLEQHARLGRVGVFSDVAERLLDEAENRDFVVGRQSTIEPLDHQIDLKAVLLAKLLHIAA